MCSGCVEPEGILLCSTCVQQDPDGGCEEVIQSRLTNQYHQITSRIIPAVILAIKLTTCIRI